ncbi:hipA domain protein [Burkholderia pseudomallei MSHR640]|nr:hipA domain protein [Burkholderia pseudomallei MSHR640]
MGVRGKHIHYPLHQIRRRHWIAQGQRVGFAPADVDALIDTLTARTAGVVDAVSARLPRDFPRDVADAIFSGMLGLSARLAGDAAARAP